MKAKEQASVLFVMCMKIARILLLTKVWHIINDKKKMYSLFTALSWQLKQLTEVVVMSSKWPVRPFGVEMGKKKKVSDTASRRRQVKASRTNYWAGHHTARHTHTQEDSHTYEYEHTLLVAGGEKGGCLGFFVLLCTQSTRSSVSADSNVPHLDLVWTGVMEPNGHPEYLQNYQQQWDRW